MPQAGDDKDTYRHQAAEAEAALAARRYQEAELQFAALCQDYPRSPQGFAGLARVADAAGNWPAALERWDDCLARFPQNSPWRWHLAKAWALFHLARYDEAGAIFASLAKDFPRD